MLAMKLIFKRIVLLFLLFSFSYVVSAQSGIKITGSVRDTAGNAVSSGNVLLFRHADSVLNRVTIIENGSFVINAIEKGNYDIKILASGYAETVISINAAADTMVTIQLKQVFQTLENVSVEYVRRIFSVSNGNIKVNVDNPVFAAIPDPINLLGKLPGVQLSPDGETVSVVGRGNALIYLDNQLISVNELKSLSFRDVKSVEILTNPPVRFEASGRVVILIARKFSKREGFKMEVSETISQKRYFHNWSAVNLNYKFKKIELSAGLQYNYLNLWESNSNIFKVAPNITSDYTVRATGPRKQLLARAGVYFQLKDEDYLSLSGNTRVHKEPFIINTQSGFNESGFANSAYTRTDNKSEKPYSSVILNYFNKLNKSNADIFIGGQYSTYTQNLLSNILNSINDSSLNKTQYRDQDFQIHAASARADFNKKLTEKTSFGAGVSYSSAWSDALLQIQFFNPAGNTRTQYKYTEDIRAAYSQVNTKIGNVSATIGLRYENALTVGKSSTNSELVINRKFDRLFPRASFTFPIDSIKTLTIAYTSSVSRPNYSNLSQIVTYINPFFEWSSNINLKPVFTDEVSATLQLGQLSFQLTAIKKQNPVYYKASYDTLGRKFTVIDDNYDRETGLNLTVTVPVNYRKLSSTNMATFSINKISDAAAVNLKSTPYVYFYSGNQLALKNGFNTFSNFWILTSRYEGIFKRNTIFGLDFGISKSFKSGLNLSLSFNDVFRSINFREEILINGVSSNIIYYDDAREISLNIRYTFGKIKNAGYRNKNVNENADRIR
jgi:hypothetical protein